MRDLFWNSVWPHGLLSCQFYVLLDLSRVLLGVNELDAEHGSVLIIVGDYHVVDFDGISHFPVATSDPVVAGARFAVDSHDTSSPNPILPHASVRRTAYPNGHYIDTILLGDYEVAIGAAASNVFSSPV